MRSWWWSAAAAVAVTAARWLRAPALPLPPVSARARPGPAGGLSGPSPARGRRDRRAHGVVRPGRVRGRRVSRPIHDLAVGDRLAGGLRVHHDERADHRSRDPQHSGQYAAQYGRPRARRAGRSGGRIPGRGGEPRTGTVCDRAGRGAVSWLGARGVGRRDPRAAVERQRRVRRDVE